LKVAARFAEQIDAAKEVLPLIQIRDVGHDISLGGAFFSRGQLALTLSENWPDNQAVLEHFRNMAHYYVGVRGTGKGSVRPAVFGDDAAIIRYELSDADVRHLSVGLARLATLLLAAGASELYPSVWGLSRIRNEEEAIRWLDESLPCRALGLVTVHAFSSCPIGQRRDRCAADSYGRIFGFSNLYINDASMLPDSPGVNPQGAIMSIARRNALYFANDVR